MRRDTAALYAAPTDTYIARDAEEKVLYVGVSVAVGTRLTQHRSSHSAWLPLMSRIDIEHYRDRASALAREAELIRSLDPPFNHVGREENMSTARRLGLDLDAWIADQYQQGVVIHEIARTVGRRRPFVDATLTRLRREGIVGYRRPPRGVVNKAAA